MKKTISLVKIQSVILSLVLYAAIALTMTACGELDNNSSANASPVTSSEGSKEDVKIIGEGKTSFVLKVTDLDGKSTDFTVKTDKKTVGDALLELNLIEGENAQYGLYIKSVNGIRADYEKDGTYWAFYIDGAYASSGVDTTDIEEGKTYELKVTKG